VEDKIPINFQLVCVDDDAGTVGGASRMSMMIFLVGSGTTAQALWHWLMQEAAADVSSVTSS